MSEFQGQYQLIEWSFVIAGRDRVQKNGRVCQALAAALVRSVKRNGAAHAASGRDGKELLHTVDADGLLVLRCAQQTGTGSKLAQARSDQSGDILYLLN